MAKFTSPQNTNNYDLDPLILTSSTTGVGKRAVNSRAVTGGDYNVADQGVATHVDDAAFTVATDSIVAIGAMADQTSPDSVDEGDVGVLRMTLDRFLMVVSQQRSSTGAKSNVAGSASSVTILASNSLRRGASVYNDSTAILYLDVTGGTASSTSYTVKMQPEDFYEIPFGYTGLITGIWASATGNARVTEWT